MVTLSSPLVLTKLSVPIARPQIVRRAHLVEQLNAAAGAKLVLICAPAGYGKTTLLAEWSQHLIQEGSAVAWYALDPSDDDPVLFASYLVASLAQALGPRSRFSRIVQILRTSTELDLQKILPSVINTIVSADRECILILDDYHLISSPAIHSALAYLLERLPGNMHIAIGSRSDPPLPLARLRARSRLLEIRANDLRFSPDETNKFLNDVMRLELSPAGVDTLESRTEGWIAGLQLAALSLSGRSDREFYLSTFTGSHRYLVDYLFEEVFNRQEEEIQAFLLSTSVLERLCAPLCDAISGSFQSSEAILAKLERSNLFLVPLDDQRSWYRYHHLFREFLETRLNKTRPERQNELHQAASDWLAANGFPREAAQQAFKTKDWDYAAAFVEQNGFLMIAKGEFSTVYEWCSAFPEETVRSHPALSILQSWALVLGFRRKDRNTIEERLKQAEQAAAALADRERGRFLIDEAAVVRTFLLMTPDPAANPQEQIALSQRVLEVHPTGGVGTMLMMGYAHMALQDAGVAIRALEDVRQIGYRIPLYYGVIESTFHLARLAFIQGHLKDAAHICLHGRAEIARLVPHAEQELPAIGSLDVVSGEIYLEQDHLEEAERELRHGLELFGTGLTPYFLMIAYTALFRLKEIQGHSTEALSYLDQLEEAWPDIAFCTQGLRVRHALRTAPQDPAVLADASAWCQRFTSSTSNDGFLPGIGPFGATEAYYLAYLAWAQVLIVTGKPQAARSYLERQLDLAKAHGLTSRGIELSLLEAQAWRAEGDDRRAWQVLEEALEAAQPAGYIRIFDQGATLTRLLVEAARGGICCEYIGQILAVTGKIETLNQGRQAGHFAQTGLIEYLSEREMEVLRLMAQGSSNHEIAGQLVITVGTVKSHINHIFGKLEVHNRTEAVARARGLGLLET
ncbi:MAG: LuxR C-terminal-related transcriptional regulator [Omnitrophica WOR_2 bacterium]